MKIFIKKILKHLIGKKLLNKIFYENVPTLKSKDFKKWWVFYRDKRDIDDDLKLMVNDLILSDNFNNLVFMLWGRNAVNKLHLLDNEKHKILMLSQNSNTFFFTLFCTL